MTDKQKERVLAWVNRVRKEKKVGPPLKRLKKGEPSNPNACPLACSLLGRKREVHVGRKTTTWAGGAATIDHPKFVTAFIDRFDAEEVPELLR